MINNKPKVLLFTLEGTYNIGNRLQHYALQKTIEKLGFEVNSLMLLPKPPHIVKLKAKNCMKRLLTSLGYKGLRKSLSTSGRAEKALTFNAQHLNHIVRMSVEEVRQTNWDDYIAAVTGSDQVWHNWHNKAIPDELSYYYLDFIDEAKRVSYAPSFGFTRFPEEDIDLHRHGLMGIRALSCREREGCKLIQDLTGRNARKVLDPTLLLPQEKWIEIEKKPVFRAPERYLLCFFLGSVPIAYCAEIKRIAEDRNLTIINLNDKDDPTHYAISPDEFIWLIHRADTVCTDSFHATVFAVLFKRNLRVFQREEEGHKDMFGRLRDLMEPLGLMNLVYGEGEELSTKLSEEAKAYLAHERDASLSYLKKSLKVE